MNIDLIFPILADSGVTTDNKTGYTAGIMLLSLIPFIIVQLSGIINTSSGNRIVVLIALIVSVSGLLAYFMYQVCILNIESNY